MARKSYDFRTLGLGYANLGARSDGAGDPYDSREARARAARSTAIMHAGAYAASRRDRRRGRAHPRYHANREAMLRVIRNHRRAAYNSRRRSTRSSR